jgi:hypothetical protein
MAKKATKMSKAAVKSRTETRKIYDKNLATKVGVRGGAKGATKASGKTERAIARDYRKADKAGLSGAERSSAAMSSGKSG